MEPRFGHDFSSVRVHDGAAAASSARAIDALAYTAGHHVVFDRGRYAPETTEGRALLAHELAHVVQQRSMPGTDFGTVGATPAAEQEADAAAARIVSARPAGPIPAAVAPSAGHAIARASPDAVGYVMRLGEAARTGLQFWPTNVVDSVVGPVSVRGGLYDSGADRLNVILGENLTPNRVAAQLLPLWTTATPFTPPGAAGPLPLDIITAAELARALLVYNQTFLPVPAMTNWRAGLRVPLPVQIDSATHIATVHPLQIRALASGFDPAWVPLLDRAAGAIGAPNVATIQAAVGLFLVAETTPLARGIGLNARAVTNAVAERPFIQEAFRQLGAAGFDVALEFMNNLRNPEAALLASQADGAAILATIRTALGTAPAVLTTAQQDGVTRANLMLAAVAGVAARAAPGDARARPEKTITVDTLKLDGATHNPADDVREADAILSQCNVRVRHGVSREATPVQTTGLINDTDLRSGNNCASPGREERALFVGGAAAFGFGARFQAFFVHSVSGISASGYSCLSGTAHAAMRNKIVVVDTGDTATLAHELGHILINLGPHTASGLMSPRPAAPAMRSPQVTNPHCTRLYDNV
ncbi:hypothetical protein C7I55_03040 [Sphingomonas deserti]|uniref:eCIS core domain-containing protein n=2 Tax=Allosphingosinicella deserti TaxID=2116704 RepID=A0A2P7R091_9SPHN|nr:hypothetical protein C7I55_03040 [Sphingomonas deserti]